MSTLYGNDIAGNTPVSFPARLSGGFRSCTRHLQQKEDDRWFGANIPGKVVSVEFVQVESVLTRNRLLLSRYEGSHCESLPPPMTRRQRLAPRISSHGAQQSCPNRAAGYFKPNILRFAAASAPDAAKSSKARSGA